jgi:hypothetical protein
MQKIKWHGIPERNVDVYDYIPEKMGFELEDITIKPEKMRKKTWEMRRIAEELLRLSTMFTKLASL